VDDREFTDALLRAGLRMAERFGYGPSEFADFLFERLRMRPNEIGRWVAVAERIRFEVEGDNGA